MHSVILLLVIAQLPKSTIQLDHSPTHSPPKPINQHESLSNSSRSLSHRSVQVHQVENNWDRDGEADLDEPDNKNPPSPPHSSPPSKSHPSLSPSSAHSTPKPHAAPPHSPSLNPSSPTHSPRAHSLSTTHSPPHRASSTTHPPPKFHSSSSTPHPSKPSTTSGYDCDNRRYNCTGPGLFSDSKDHTIFFRCRFKPKKNRYRATCFTCNWKFQKCFNKHVNACIPCDQATHKKDQVPELISQKTSYDCKGYEAFACSQLGYGLHEHPGDRSISVHCTNDTGEWLGGCITCPRDKLSCFIEGLGQCVENCADNQNHSYDCSHYKVDPHVPCKEKGKFGMIGRSTTYFECKEGKDGKILPTCKPCPKDEYFDKFKKNCTSKEDNKDEKDNDNKDMKDNSTNLLEARRSKSKGNGRSKWAIPRFTTILHNYKGYGYSLRPNPEKTFITAPFRSYDCKKVSYSCKAQGIFVNPMDPSVWFECTMDRKINKWRTRCRPCPNHTCFDLAKRTCVNTCQTIDQSWFAKCRDKWTDKCDKLLSMGR